MTISADVLGNGMTKSNIQQMENKLGKFIKGFTRSCNSKDSTNKDMGRKDTEIKTTHSKN